MTLNGQKSKKKQTVFTHGVGDDLKIGEASFEPTDFLNVLHIGLDVTYGDVFKAWDSNENKFVIFFGTAGDEF